eukprot:tig00021612_g22876.t1
MASPAPAEETIDIELAASRRRARTYEQRAQQLEAMLQRLGMSSKNLPADAQSMLRALAEAASELELREPTLNSMYIAIDNLQRELFELAEKAEEEQEELKTEKEAADKAEELHRSVKKAYDAAVRKEAEAQASYDTRQAELEALMAKREEYTREIEKQQRMLQCAGYNKDEVEHGMLVKIAAEVEEIKTVTQPLLSKLRSYLDLPPDLSLARLKVAQARARLKELEDEVSRRVGLMGLEGAGT